MGSYVSQIKYVQPPPPPSPNYTVLDLENPNFTMATEKNDPDGLKMCFSIARREGITAAIFGSSLTGGGTYIYALMKKNKSSNKSLIRPPVIAFVCACSGYFLYTLISELVMHDCDLQRTAYLEDYYKNNPHLMDISISTNERTKLPSKALGENNK